MMMINSNLTWPRLIKEFILFDNNLHKKEVCQYLPPMMSEIFSADEDSSTIVSIILLLIFLRKKKCY